MDEKFKAGLAKQTFDELENLRDLREAFINSHADADYVETLEGMMNLAFEMYISLSKPNKAK